MNAYATNPFLKIDEYVCDGEVHVFGNRAYIYGSHDSHGSDTFCGTDYVVYSANVYNMCNWEQEGVIYSSSQDPNSTQSRNFLYAPDVVQGNDGRFYLYYALAGYRGEQGFNGPISVAVCDTPCGKFEYLGEVKNHNNTPLEYIPFDPAVINDNGHIFLYYGWALPNPIKVTPEMQDKLDGLYLSMFNQPPSVTKKLKHNLMGANVVELCQDMLTTKGEPNRIVPAEMDAFDTSFEGHAFFEASSIRKIENTYYFVYSSSANHELCYATSKYPNKNFTYGGIIVSGGDIGINGRQADEKLSMTGNNHGCIEKINDQYYIFYHRQTHKSTYSRQQCAEKITIEPDGSIKQVEVTSCGLSPTALPAQGVYSAAICCNLTNGHMPHNPNGICTEDIPFIVQRNGKTFITQIKNKTMIGYKYFSFTHDGDISVLIRGNGNGILVVKDENNKLVCSFSISASLTFKSYTAYHNLHGIHPLFFYFLGDGDIDFLSFCFS